MQYTRHGHACLGLCGQHGEDYWWCSKSRRLPLPNLNLAEDGQVQTTRLRTIGGSIARPASTAPGEPSLLASSEVVHSVEKGLMQTCWQAPTFPKQFCRYIHFLSQGSTKIIYEV